MGIKNYISIFVFIFLGLVQLTQASEKPKNAQKPQRLFMGASVIAPFPIKIITNPKGYKDKIFKSYYGSLAKDSISASFSYKESSENLIKIDIDNELLDSIKEKIYFEDFKYNIVSKNIGQLNCRELKTSPKEKFFLDTICCSKNKKVWKLSVTSSNKNEEIKTAENIINSFYINPKAINLQKLYKSSIISPYPMEEIILPKTDETDDNFLYMHSYKSNSPDKINILFQHFKFLTKVNTLSMDSRLLQVLKVQTEALEIEKDMQYDIYSKKINNLDCRELKTAPGQQFFLNSICCAKDWSLWSLNVETIFEEKNQKEAESIIDSFSIDLDTSAAEISDDQYLGITMNTMSFLSNKIKKFLDENGLDVTSIPSPNLFNDKKLLQDHINQGKNTIEKMTDQYISTNVDKILKETAETVYNDCKTKKYTENACRSIIPKLSGDRLIHYIKTNIVLLQDEIDFMSFMITYNSSNITNELSHKKSEKLQKLIMDAKNIQEAEKYFLGYMFLDLERDN